LVAANVNPGLVAIYTSAFKLLLALDSIVEGLNGEVSGLAGHLLSGLLTGDPPLPDATMNLDLPFPAPPGAANTQVEARASHAAGHAAGVDRATGVVTTGVITASWSSTAGVHFLISSLGAMDATVLTSRGTTVGAGALGLSTPSPTAASVSGSAAYSFSGT